MSYYILSKPRPCPFCGSNIILVMNKNLICLTCGARGPCANFEKEAIVLWEERSLEINFTSEIKKADDL